MEEIFFRKLGKGKPVILIHGFCETQEIWKGYAEDLGEEFEVFAIDLPGFGQSQIPTTPFSMQDVSRKMLSWIDQNNIHQPFIIGHSLGGYVALAMAQGDVNNISGICLFHSTPYPDTEERKSNRNRVMEFVRTNGVGPFVETFVPGLFFDKKHAAIPYVDSIARKTSQETLLAYTVAMRDRLATIDFLRGYGKPTLFLAGEMDTIIPVESILEIGRMVRNCTVQVLNNTAHMAMFEQPEKAKNVLRDFIREL